MRTLALLLALVLAPQAALARALAFPETALRGDREISAIRTPASARQLADGRRETACFYDSNASAMTDDPINHRDPTGKQVPADEELAAELAPGFVPFVGPYLDMVRAKEAQTAAHEAYMANTGTYGAFASALGAEVLAGGFLALDAFTLGSFSYARASGILFSTTGRNVLEHQATRVLVTEAEQTASRTKWRTILQTEQPAMEQAAQAELARFRERAGLPPFAANSGETGTAALAVGGSGRKAFGLNSTFSPGDEVREQAFKLLQDAGLAGKATRYGQQPFLLHAEAEALLRLANKGDDLSVVRLFVDRGTCNLCSGGLQKLRKALGIKRLEIYNHGVPGPIDVIE